MKNTISRTIILFTLLAVLTYAIIAFIRLQPDPQFWSENDRAVLSIMPSVMSVIYFLSELMAEIVAKK